MTRISGRSMQAEKELPHLVRLLDDQHPVVRQSLRDRLEGYGGDVSRELSELGISLDEDARVRLSRMLAPGRRAQVRREWAVPAAGFEVADGDWEKFEFLMRLLSELLHDGTTVRPALPDCLDRLSDEAVLQGAHHDEAELCRFLFGSGRFRANDRGFYRAENADLLWVLQHRQGNPIGLTVVAMLVAQRLGLRILGCNFPAHFLGWITVDGNDHLIDCYHRGRLIAMDELRENSSVLTPDAQNAISQPCSLRAILRRILANLHLAFARSNHPEDAEVAGELLASLDD